MKRSIKGIIALCIIGLLAAPAWAGNIPEYDAVGCDVYNVFAWYNELQYGQTAVYNYGDWGPVNYFSDFTDNYFEDPLEFFETTAGQLFDDPCFWDLQSALTDAGNEGAYEWQIVLQMKPESDINVNIYDCVLKHNSFSPWGYEYGELAGAEQTGRYRADWGELKYIKNANPIITVKAIPGEFATPGFTEPMIMDARTLPELNMTPLNGKLYTSKAIWDEALVLVLPKTGETNMSGYPMYNLKQGDMINVKVEIPFNNTVDIRYGADSVILKYIGIVGTWYYALDESEELIFCGDYYGQSTD